MKTKKIFIALPNYEYPNSLMDYGVQLSKSLDKSALLIGIEKMPIPVAPISGVASGVLIHNMTTMQDVIEVVEPKLTFLKLKAKEIWQDVDFDLEIGFPESKLEEMTDDEHPYMVVLEGNQQLDTLNEWFGTYETRMAENLEVPVLIVHPNNNWTPLKNIVYLMDVNDDAVENMRTLSDIAKQTNAHITLVFINGDNDEVAEQNPKYLRMVKVFSQFLGYEKVTYMQIFSKNANNEIKDLVREKKANWLAFQHKDQSFFTRIFDDMNTEHLILQSKIPVLVF